MAAVVIFKKDVEKLGKEVLKEVFDFFHDEYIMNNFLEMKLQKQKFLKYLVYKNFEGYNAEVVKKGNSWELKYDDYDENKFEEDLKCLTDKVNNGSIDIEVIFQSLNNVDLDDEIDGDLYYKTASFIDLYKVISCSYDYLED